MVERLDANANVLSTAAFDRFGHPFVGNSADPWGFDAQAGYYTDAETGLQLLTHRYYDPGQGRFLTRDPTTFDGTNLYGYTDNDPMDAYDPDGLAKKGKMRCYYFHSGGCGYIICMVNNKRVLHDWGCNKTAAEMAHPKNWKLRRNLKGKSYPAPPGTYPLGAPFHSHHIHREVIPIGIKSRPLIRIHAQRDGTKPLPTNYPTEGCIRVQPTTVERLKDLLGQYKGSIEIGDPGQG